MKEKLIGFIDDFFDDHLDIIIGIICYIIFAGLAVVGLFALDYICTYCPVLVLLIVIIGILLDLFSKK